MTTAKTSIRIPWGSCSGWVSAMQESAGQIGVGLHLDSRSDWGSFATWYEVIVTGPAEATLTFIDWLKGAVVEVQQRLAERKQERSP